MGKQLPKGSRPSLTLADVGSEQTQHPHGRARLCLLALEMIPHIILVDVLATPNVKRVLKKMSRKKNRYLPKTKTAQATVRKINALKKLFKLGNANTHHTYNMPPLPQLLGRQRALARPTAS